MAEKSKARPPEDTLTAGTGRLVRSTVTALGERLYGTPRPPNGDRGTRTDAGRSRSRLTDTMRRLPRKLETGHHDANRSKCRLLTTASPLLRVNSPFSASSVIDSTTLPESRYVFRLSFIKTRKQSELIDEKRYTFRSGSASGTAEIDV